MMKKNIQETLLETKKLINIKSSESHICNFELKKSKCKCTNKTKDNNIYCKIHMNCLKKKYY